MTETPQAPQAQAPQIAPAGSSLAKMRLPNFGFGCATGGGSGGGCTTGSSSGGLGPHSTPEDFIRAGSPQLALAKAKGATLTPWVMTINAVLPDASTPALAQTSADQIIQDTLVTQMTFRLINGGSANTSTLQTMSDYYFNFQSGIQVTLNVGGRPGYPVVENYTDFSIVIDTLCEGRGSIDGWILRDSQFLKMDFRPTIALPTSNVPINVSVAFKCWTAIGDEWVHMKNRSALDQLANDFGMDCGQSYEACMCGVTGTGSVFDAQGRATEQLPAGTR